MVLRGLQKIMKNMSLSAQTRGCAASGIGQLAACMVNLGLGTHDQQKRLAEELMAHYSRSSREAEVQCGLVVALGALLGSFPPVHDMLGTLV